MTPKKKSDHSTENLSFGESSNKFHWIPTSNQGILNYEFVHRNNRQGLFQKICRRLISSDLFVVMTLCVSDEITP